MYILIALIPFSEFLFSFCSSLSRVASFPFKKDLDLAAPIDRLISNLEMK